MRVRQVFAACFCVILASQPISAVVNNGSNPKTPVESTSSSSNVNSESTESDSANLVADSATASSEKETSRRDVPLGLNDAFGNPIALESLYGAPLDSYLPEVPSNLGLPLPVYGVPNAGNNLIYPAPPPDIPPPLPTLTYGVPNNLRPPKITYVPAKIYGPPKHSVKYGPPFLQRPPKPFNPPVFNKGIKTFYAAPNRFQSNLRPGKEQFGLLKPPKPFIGPPKLQYGPPKLLHGVPLIAAAKPIFRPPGDGILNPPPLLDAYGPPTITIDIISDVGKQKFPVNYGPPEPVPHGPPHPGAPAPPTPPDIKYDGWQPIPGLVSRPPHQQGSVDIQISGEFIPPPVGTSGVHSLGLQDNYKSSGVISDSYGAPLNTVTGSGGIISTSGEASGQQHQAALNIDLSNIGLADHDNSLSVIRSVGYELFNNNAGFRGGHLDTYTSPPVNSYSPNGPYAAAHSYSTLSQAASTGSFFGSTGKQQVGFGLSSSGAGLIPPNGLYGVAPSSQYGTPLFQPNLNALDINPPKHPVIFRDPVPHGLIESIGNGVAQKDAQGIIESHHANLGGPAYIPPPVPDITKPVIEFEPPHPSNLYSLPNVNGPVSFQNVVHGSSTAGLVSDYSGGTFGANFGGIDGTFALPLKTSQINFNVDQTHNNAINVDVSQGGQYNLDQSSHGYSFGVDQLGGQVFNNGFNIEQNHGGFDFNSLSGVQNLGGYQQHDCGTHKSQPLPQLSYGVPSANTYTESLSSLKTNIGGSFQGQLPHLTYGPPDLQAAHSQSSVRVNEASSNLIAVDNNGKETYGKSLGESFAAGGELIKSQSLDLNNIPVQGVLGSYTLQIQSADGLGSASTPGQVPHEQVLNDGLLQSILAAIEQPQAQNVNILGQPLLQHIRTKTQAYDEITNSANVGTESTSSDVEDVEAQQSVRNSVAVSPPPPPPPALSEAQNTSKTEITQGTNSNAPLQLVDNNEIALYFSNNSDDKRNGEGGSGQEDKTDKVLNGQQYGSYVSFKTPNASYVYGDLKSSQNEQTSDVKE